MSRLILLLLVPALLAGCTQGDDGSKENVTRAPEAAKRLIKADPPPPMAVPDKKTVKSEDDWEAKAHNKEIEVIQVINVINPVATYITEGFKLYGAKFSATVHEEWSDTQEQLNKAMALYDSCKKRKATGKFDKQLFLDLEEVWQLLVKTGVAGVRAKSMIDDELRRLTG
ncbi:MAG: hypothetical protein ACE5GW_02135 [Planctomycetota bacterium]